jgi:alpha-1,2-mannosyltransferase
MKWLLTFFLAVCVLGMALGDASDFRVYYQAALRLWVGGWNAVYDPQALTPFKYHPAAVLFFLPWAVLPFGVAKVLWALFQGWMLWDVKTRLGKWGVSQTVFLVALLFVVHALTWQLKFANVTIAMLWLMVVAAQAKSATAAVAAPATVLLLKPTWLVLALAGALGLSSKQARGWNLRVVLGVAGVLAAVTGLVLIFSGGSVFELWWHTLRDPLHAHNYPKNDNQSWYALCFRWKQLWNVQWVWALGSIAFATLFCLISWPYRASRAALILATALPWIWISPLSWIHHQILFVPILAVLLSTLPPRRWSHAHTLLAVVWVSLNGTGELFLGRAGFTIVNQAGVALLGVLALLALLPRFYKQLSGLQE